MITFTNLLEELNPQTDPSIPVRGILISEDPAAEPGYIYVDSASNITKVLEDKAAKNRLPKSGLSSSPFQEIIAEAFSGASADLYSLDKSLDALPGMKQFKCGLVIRTLAEDGRPFVGGTGFPGNILDKLTKFFPRDHFAVVDDSIYILRSSAEIITEFTIDDPEGLEKLLAAHNAFAMLGNPSQWLKGLRVLYGQCYQTLPIAAAVRYGGEAGKRILHYSRFAFYYSLLLAEKAAKREMGTADLVYLCDASILKLTRYDRQFNSDLRDTLFIYLMRDRNISAAARELHVHRNTVIYKLNQIKGLIGDKDDDPYMRHSLISSCMIIRYLENYRKRDIDLPPVEKSLLKK